MRALDLTDTLFGAWVLAALQTARLARVQRGPWLREALLERPFISGTAPDAWLTVEFPSPVPAGSEGTARRVVDLLRRSAGVRLKWAENCARAFGEAAAQGGDAFALFGSLRGKDPPSVLERLVREAGEERALPADEAVVVAAHVVRELLPAWVDDARPIDPWFARQALVLMAIVHFPHDGRSPDPGDAELVARVVRMAAGDLPLRPVMTRLLDVAPGEIAEVPAVSTAAVSVEGGVLLASAPDGARYRLAVYPTAAEARMAARVLGLRFNLGREELAGGRAFLEEAAEDPEAFRAAGVADVDLEVLRADLARLEADPQQATADRVGGWLTEMWTRVEASQRRR